MISSTELDKIAKWDRLKRVGQKIINYSSGVKGNEDNLKGVNRIRQVLRGDLTKDLYNRYSTAAPGLEKETLMRKLVDEDGKTFWSRAGALGGTYVGGALGLEAGGKVLGKIVGTGANKLTESLSKDIQVTDNKKDKFQNNLNSVRKQYGRIPSEILERMGDPNLTDKITAQEALGIPMGAAINSGIFGLTAKPMMGNLLGAQTFYHGTAKENVPKILKEGIDPQYGGIEGGGAWKIKERNELYNKYKNKEISIDDLKKSLLDKKLLIPEEVQSLNKRTISNLEAKIQRRKIVESDSKNY
jgi:hypothetical protein